MNAVHLEHIDKAIFDRVEQIPRDSSVLMFGFAVRNRWRTYAVVRVVRADDKNRAYYDFVEPFMSFPSDNLLGQLALVAG